jgi:hypothetical protein
LVLVGKILVYVTQQLLLITILKKNCYSSANSNDNPIEAIELKYIPFWKSLILEYWVLPLLNFFFPKFIFCKTRK